MRTYNVVVVMQHVNWEDDGGEHDPVLVTVDQQFLTELETYHNGAVPADAWGLKDRLRNTPRPTLPCQLDAVFNIWHNF
jgi:hypothetical protein